MGPMSGMGSAAAAGGMMGLPGMPGVFELCGAQACIISHGVQGAAQ